MVPVEFHHPAEIAHCKQIKEYLNNEYYWGWVRCDNEWWRIENTRGFNNISALGGLRGQYVSSNAQPFRYFTYLAIPSCRFTGPSYEEGTHVRHLTSMSFRPMGPNNVAEPSKRNELDPNKVIKTPHDLSDRKASPRGISFSAKLFYLSLSIDVLGVLGR